MKSALELALLEALKGQPIGTLKKQLSTAQRASPAALPAVQPARIKPRDAEARHARFMKGFHLPGFKHKAQTETIRDRVQPFLVRGIHAKHGLPEW